MTYSARKVVLNVKNFCTDSHLIVYKGSLQTLCQQRWNIHSQMEHIDLDDAAQKSATVSKWKIIFHYFFKVFLPKKPSIQMYLLIIILRLYFCDHPKITKYFSP